MSVCKVYWRVKSSWLWILYLLLSKFASVLPILRRINYSYFGRSFSFGLYKMLLMALVRVVMQVSWLRVSNDNSSYSGSICPSPFRIILCTWPTMYLSYKTLIAVSLGLSSSSFFSVLFFLISDFLPMIAFADLNLVVTPQRLVHNLSIVCFWAVDT